MDGADLYLGGIVGENRGTVTGCTFNGDATAALVGGIVGGNGGTVTNCHKPVGKVTTEGITLYEGGVIGVIFPSSSVTISGNTFSRSATGQEWGIGNDTRLSPAAPSNNGVTPNP